MDGTTALLIAAAVYFFVLKPSARSVTTTGGLRPPASASGAPGGFNLTIPGVVDYRNAYGVGTSIQVNPDLFSAFFGRGAESGPAAPQPALDPMAAYPPVADVILPVPPPPDSFDYWADTFSDFGYPGPV